MDVRDGTQEESIIIVDVFYHVFHGLDASIIRYKS